MDRVRSWRTRLYRPALLWVFVGLVVLLAYLEEGARDLLVWREHAGLFGGWQLPALPKELLAVIVPLLILPSGHPLRARRLDLEVRRLEPGVASVRVRRL